MVSYSLFNFATRISEQYSNDFMQNSVMGCSEGWRKMHIRVQSEDLQWQDVRELQSEESGDGTTEKHDTQLGPFSWHHLYQCKYLLISRNSD